MSLDENKLIDSWIALQSSKESYLENDENFWAFEKIDELSEDEPVKCLNIIIKICEKSENEKILANVAAGPLEDLLARNGKLVIEDFEEIAKNDLKVKKVLASVWQNNIDPVIWHRLKKVTGNLSGF